MRARLKSRGRADRLARPVAQVGTEPPSETAAGGASWCLQSRARQILTSNPGNAAQRPPGQGRRGLPPAWMEEVVPRVGKAPVLEHAPETTFRKVRLHHAFRHIRQARS